VAIDYDPRAQRGNQVNRIKLMLSVAFKNLGLLSQCLRPAVDWQVSFISNSVKMNGCPCYARPTAARLDAMQISPVCRRCCAALRHKL